MVFFHSYVSLPEGKLVALALCFFCLAIHTGVHTVQSVGMTENESGLNFALSVYQGGMAPVRRSKSVCYRNI